MRILGFSALALLFSELGVVNFLAAEAIQLLAGWVETLMMTEAMLAVEGCN